MASVEVSMEGFVAIVTLNRPETGNTLSPDLMEELARAMERLDADDDARCVIVSGGGDAFASGDVASFRGEAAARATYPVSEFWERFTSCETPVIAAVSGFALGAGFELALACDIIIASDSAEFGLPEITLGLIPGGGGTQRLARAVGRHHAMEIVLTGRRIKAEQARKMGLVNAVHGRADHLEKALEIATVISRRSPIAAKLAKRAVLSAEEANLEAGLAAERNLHQKAMATEDRIEGMNAFIEKRQPDFKGR